MPESQTSVTDARKSMPRIAGRSARIAISRTVSLLLVFATAPWAVAQAGWGTLGDLASFKRLADGVEVEAQHGSVRVTVVSPTLIRVRYVFAGQSFERPSFAVLADALRPGETKLQVEDSETKLSLDTGVLAVQIWKSPLRFSFLGAQGELMAEDPPALAPVFAASGFKMWKTMPEDEHYFGLGDKTGPMDHRNLAFTMWNTDAFGWQESTDPLYKDIPFILAFRNGTAYGLYLDNTFRSSFDFGKERADAYSLRAPGGSLDYYFIYGPNPKRVVEQFTGLVGRTPLPPLFVLGYQQCRYSYYPESQVRNIASEFRRRKIPADVIYLDIDYQEANRPFTVNRERFPNFQDMIRDLGRQGFKVVAITDLHIAKVPGSKPYDEGMKSNYFVKNPDGSIYVGQVWPGDSVFPDFTREEVRRWWGTLYADFVRAGIRGFWNDMNEPAIFSVASKTMPLDTVHSVEGSKADHREIHNVFGMENARATYEGLLRLQPDLRPFVLTRAAFAGSERYAATWTGDNTATWNHMRISLPQLMNLGLSGYAFTGADIGGFNGNPTPELLTRWMELGTFMPIYRNHSAKGTRFREPWVDGAEHESIRRRAIETRYRLLPYIYTSMEETSRTGVPLMRPLFLEFPDQARVALNDQEFMFGPSLLVAPKVWDFTGKYTVDLPDGDWYDFWTGAKVSGQRLEVDPGLDTLPVYVRAGSIIPQQALVENTDETPQGPLQLNVYPGPQCHGTVYSDDGRTLAYQHGDDMRLEIACSAGANQITVELAPAKGSYHPWFQDIQLRIYGITGAVTEVRADSQHLDWSAQPGMITLSSLHGIDVGHQVRIALEAK